MNNRAKGPGSFQDILQQISRDRAAPVVLVVLLASLFIALAGFPWVWLIAGVVVLAVLYPYLSKMGNAASTTSSGTPQLFNQATNSVDLRNLQGRYLELMQRALTTRGRIEEAIGQTPDMGQRSVLADSTKALPELTDNIYMLAQKAQSVQSGMGAENPMERLANEVKELEAQIKGTTDEFQKSQYYAAMDGKLQQMQNMTDTTVAMRRWDAQIENALSTLDTLLSQVLRIKSSEVLSYTGATDELSNSLKREVDSLKAASNAMNTVYGWDPKS